MLSHSLHLVRRSTLFAVTLVSLSFNAQAMDSAAETAQPSLRDKQARLVQQAQADLHPFWAAKNSPSLRKLDEDSAKYVMVGPRAQRIQWFDNLGHCSRVAQETLNVLSNAYGEGLNQSGLNEKTRLIFNLAGRLHDIGKQGRDSLFNQTNEAEKDYWYNVKRDADNNITEVEYKYDCESHCEVGFNMILGRTPYRMCDGSLFDFDKLFEELGIDNDDRRFIAIMVGIHFSFGNVENKMVPNPLSIQDFITKLHGLFISATESENIRLGRRMLHLAILIQVADIFGLCPCCSGACSFEPARTADVVAPKAFGYVLDENNTSPALEKMKRVLAHFDQIASEQAAAATGDDSDDSAAA